ncbi:small ribosomal subunit protein mS26 [Anopheles ziemanni]|uniref:small ribosomal subunit protein mS26 n=1 Tax=Anopheles coustani TaxID=139045 RepID=UPI002657D38B|nr:small ribosomal subunit protein mS26 [Anopheles coustani]XP_058172932.1 small ribosomal subunit protein mS26 [Anopheles ziemanni]
MASLVAAFSGVFTKPRALALLQYTTVRYRRKPRWLGTAKSKLFRVPERRKQIEEEVEELKRLHNNYRTQMKAVRNFLRDEVEAYKLVSRAGLVLQTPEEEEAEWQDALRRNDEWNQQTAAEREERLTAERAARKEFILERLVLKEQREMSKQEEVEAKVRAEKEQSKTFITRENIDKAIELALVQPTSYNFALDRDGNIHRANNSSTTDNIQPY